MKILLTLLRQALPPQAWERGKDRHLKHIISTALRDAETLIFPAQVHVRKLKTPSAGMVWVFSTHLFSLKMWSFQGQLLSRWRAEGPQPSCGGGKWQGSIMSSWLGTAGTAAQLCALLLWDTDVTVGSPPHLLQHVDVQSPLAYCLVPVSDRHYLPMKYSILLRKLKGEYGFLNAQWVCSLLLLKMHLLLLTWTSILCLTFSFWCILFSNGLKYLYLERTVLPLGEQEIP